MSSFFKKYKFELDIILVVLAVLVSVLNWYDFFENDKKLSWIGGIIFAIWAIIKLGDIVENYRSRKVIKQKEDVGANLENER